MVFLENSIDFFLITSTQIQMEAANQSSLRNYQE